MATYLVIFGAAVRPDGRPSGVLRRRIDGALAAAEAIADPWFLTTGGLGREGHVEAQVMADHLRAGGAPAGRILIEGQARDTLQSVRLCHAILSARGDADEVVVCTSRFHQLRCAMLLSLLGHRVRRPPMPLDRPHLGRGRWAAYVGKEFFSTPYDGMLMLGDLAARRIERNPRWRPSGS